MWKTNRIPISTYYGRGVIFAPNAHINPTLRRNYYPHGLPNGGKFMAIGELSMAMGSKFGVAILATTMEINITAYKFLRAVNKRRRDQKDRLTNRKYKWYRQ